MTALARARGTVAGDAARFMLPQPIGDPAAVVTADLAPLDVGGRYDLTSHGGRGGRRRRGIRAETSARAIYDPRQPVPIPTGPRLLWASQPSGAGWSELALRWAAAAGARFRVYLGDEGRLAAALGIPVNQAEMRAARAGRIWARSRDLADRRQFTLLTEQPIEEQGGTVVFRAPVAGVAARRPVRPGRAGFGRRSRSRFRGPPASSRSRCPAIRRRLRPPST